MSHSHSGADLAAARAVIRHHAQLAAVLDRHVRNLLEAAEHGDDVRAQDVRADLLGWLREELLPHADAEETALYPVAADRAEAALLIRGMRAEHRAITDLVAELDATTEPVRLAAAARALAGVLAVHLAKENELIVPLLVDAADVSLAALLDGMHDLLGSSKSAGGCGGTCGCGGGPATTDAAAPVLTIDPRLDVRLLPHDRRHTTVLAALDAMPAGGALVLIAPHAPRPLLAEIEARYRGNMVAEWLQDGPDTWQVRLSRQPDPA
ncbi:DUF2249 domain-containing protein [Micromonospora eburnea]|uniref:Uncharacterized conserved protein, DUF2249 family n=1 Tax=Micromonospora eburnea TaxID=227316 RepID=A0A1C6UWZ4_9ACTN|nr:DUF2249 domain-containing protein [Micromonospora eburnea]SCL58567.1 Uncharacterized conserved protein, DUF2249 family [Micromonospora eburnea]